MSNTQRFVAVSIPLTDTTCGDIMCTALEGGIGYWCRADKIERVDDKADPVGWRYASFEAIDAEEGDKLGRVDYEVIRTGLERCLSPHFRMSESVREQIFRELLEGAADPVRDGVFGGDAEACDAIVQAGLFNEIVYG